MAGGARAVVARDAAGAEMNVVVLADRPGRALAPFTERTCVALLPVVGKPLVVHALESIARLPSTHVFLAVSPHADAVEAELGDGRRWGLEIEYVLTRGVETPDEVVDRIRPRLKGDFLVVRGDTLLSPCLPEFLERADRLAGPTVSATVDGRPTGLRLVRAGAPSLLGMPADPERPDGWREDVPTVEIPEARFSGIATLAEFHRANLDAIAGRFGALIVPGRAVKPGIVVGRQTRLPPDCVRAGPVFVGSRCDVKPGAELHGNVVLADDVVVDRKATLKGAVVLPHTYVGELVDVSDAIVWKNEIVHLESGAAAHVTDEFLLADLGVDGLEEGATAIVHRMLGALLLVLSAPLWPILLVASLLRDPARPFRRVRLVSNRTEAGADGRAVRLAFDTFEGATDVPLLRRLPLLLAVVRGDIRLVGVSPLTPEEAKARTEPWERIRDDAPAGLLGPAQLVLAGDAPEEERWVLEAYYAQTRSPTGDLAWLARGLAALFTPRAWGPGLRPRTS